MFPDGEMSRTTGPLKVVYGLGAASLSSVLVMWSPEGNWMVNANETTTRVFKYQQDGHSFKNVQEFSSDLAVHPRKRGVSHVSFSALNDKYLVTSFNIQHTSQGDSLAQTSLVIYDLNAAEITHRINQQSTTVNMATNTLSVNLHPSMDRVCVTTDIDGQIIFWDCLLGTAIRIFHEHAAHIGLPLESNAVSDCNFSKCGNFLVVGTSYGSFSLYGYGGGECYEHQETEQFLSTDYTDYNLTPDTYQIISLETGLELGKQEEGRFRCNFNMTPHPVHPRGSTYQQGRAQIDERLQQTRFRVAETRQVDEDKLKDVADILKVERRKMIEAKKRVKETLGENRPRKPSPQREEAREERPALPSVPTQPLPRVVERPVSETSEDDYPRGHKRLRRNQNGLVSDGSVSESQLMEPDSDADESESVHNRYAMQTRRRSERLNRLGRRTAGGMVLRSRAEDGQLGKRDIVENSEADSEEFYQHFGRGRKVKEGKETPHAEEELFCSRCRKVGAREKCEGGCGRVFHVNCGQVSGMGRGDSWKCWECLPRRGEGLHYSKRELDDMWLDIQCVDPDYMAPQMEDQYYFIPQAYELFLSRFYPLFPFGADEHALPWHLHPQLQDRECKCKVVEIEYEFPHIQSKKNKLDLKNYLTILMKLTLEIVDNEQGDRFTVRYFPVNDLPAFLVWHRLYERRAREYFNAPIYSEIKFQGEYLNIKEKSPLEDSFPNNLFHSIRARAVLDGISTRGRERTALDGETLFSPWEVEFQPPLRQKRQEMEIVEEPINEDIDLEGLKTAFEECMQSIGRYCGPFLFEVDKHLYPDYPEIVKVEMYLCKIYNRLAGNYYRSAESVYHDISLILLNAKLFNDSQSKIVLQAELICTFITETLKGQLKGRDAEKLLRQIANTGFNDPKFNIDIFKANKSDDENEMQDNNQPDKDNIRKRLGLRERVPVRAHSNEKIEYEENTSRMQTRQRALRTHKSSDDMDMEETPKIQFASRADRHKQRLKKNVSPPKVNGMQLRHRK